MSTAYEKAIDYLSRREHSVRELQQKLARHGFSSDEIDGTVTRVIEQKYQSDVRFAESYIRYRQQAGFGPLKIIAELRERGVADAVIDAHIELKSTLWFDLLRQQWQKKFNKHNAVSSDKQIRFLLSRGFSLDMIYVFLKTPI